MKRLSLIFLLVGLAAMAMAQQKPEYVQTKTNQVLTNNAGRYKQAFMPPSGPTPGFPSYVPDSLKCGALFNKTGGASDTLMVYDCKTSKWLPVSRGLEIGALGFENYGVYYNNATGKLAKNTNWSFNANTNLITNYSKIENYADAYFGNGVKAFSGSPFRITSGAPGQYVEANGDSFYDSQGKAFAKQAEIAAMYAALSGANHFTNQNYFSNGSSETLIDGGSISANLGRIVFGGSTPFLETYAGLPFQIKSGSGTGGITFQNDSLRDSQGRQFLKLDGSGNLNLGNYSLNAYSVGASVFALIGYGGWDSNGITIQGVTHVGADGIRVNSNIKTNSSLIIGNGNNFTNDKWAVVQSDNLGTRHDLEFYSDDVKTVVFSNNGKIKNNISGNTYLEVGDVPSAETIANNYLSYNNTTDKTIVMGGVSNQNLIVDLVGQGNFIVKRTGTATYTAINQLAINVANPNIPAASYMLPEGFEVGRGDYANARAKYESDKIQISNYAYDGAVFLYYPQVAAGSGSKNIFIPSPTATNETLAFRSDLANLINKTGDNNLTGNQNIDGNISLTGNLITGNDISANNIFVPNTVSFGVLYKSLPSGGYFAIANDISPNDVDIRSSSGAGQVRGIRLKGDGSVFIGNVANNAGVTVSGNNLNANDIQAAGLLVSHYNGTTSMTGQGIYNGGNSLTFDGDGSWRFTAPVKLPSAYPTDPLHAAPKAYVDNAITGLFWKNAVRVRTTGNITLSGLQTIDGQTGGTYRVLVNAQTNPAENGIYDQKSGAWTRAIDADTGDEIWGSTVMVTNGTLYRNTQWTNINTASPTPGTDAITYGQISGAGTYSSSSGINLSANVFTLDQSFTRGLFSKTGPLTYNNSTGVFGINQASGSQDGYLSAANWTTFNNKQNAIALPAGQVGYSDGSTIVGTSNLVWDNTNGTLKLGTGAADANAILKVTAASGSKGMVVGTSAYPSWMGTNGLYVDGGFRASSYFINSGGGLNFGGSGARIVGVNTNVGQDSYLGFYTGGGAPFATNGERMRIIDDGKVGIGIVTPQAILHTASGASAQNTIGAMLQNSGGTVLNTSVSLDFTITTATTNQSTQGRVAAIRTNRAVSGDADLAFYAQSNGSLLERLRLTDNGNFGFLTSAPTHTITLGSGSTGLAMYRTANQTTDFERVLMGWNGTTFQINSDNAGAGVTRNLLFGAGASTMTFSSAGINSSAVEFKRDNSAITTIMAVTSAGLTGTSVQNAFAIYPTINQSNAATGGYNGLFISPFEQSLGTGTKYLINAGINTAANGTGVHTSKFYVDNNGNTLVAGALTSAGRRGGVTPVKTANYSAIFSDEVIQCNSTAGSFNVTLLPNAPIGTWITVDNTDGTANTVTVVGTINGVTNYTLNSNKVVTIYKTASATNTWKISSIY